ncbi:hypothetical protein [Spinactinospora alkalitolerans]|uniref:hypothetical protein n=1 Tax=Spinactinospora alkalitolerans TaxID=687207 RepID=UPI001FEB1DDD|nr:hypothetical protein [Spinactinospora alkalitolerans]
MWDVLSALIPPAVVATVFCTFIYRLLRKEMAPRTSDGRLIGEAGAAPSTGAPEAETASRADTDAVTSEDGAKGARGSSSEVPGAERGPGNR